MHAHENAADDEGAQVSIKQANSRVAKWLLTRAKLSLKGASTPRAQSRKSFQRQLVNPEQITEKQFEHKTTLSPLKTNLNIDVKNHLILLPQFLSIATAKCFWKTNLFL
jgi:hypothetical protein